MGAHNLYILRESGECLKEYCWGSITTDPQLVSGYLSAMNSFSKEVFGGGLKHGKVKFSVEEEYQFVKLLYKPEGMKDGLLIVAACDPEDDKDICQRFVEKSLEAFWFAVPSKYYVENVNMDGIEQSLTQSFRELSESRKFSLPKDSIPGYYLDVAPIEYIRMRFEDDLEKMKQKRMQEEENNRRLREQKELRDGMVAELKRITHKPVKPT